MTEIKCQTQIESDEKESVLTLKFVCPRTEKSHDNLIKFGAWLRTTARRLEGYQDFLDAMEFINILNQEDNTDA